MPAKKYKVAVVMGSTSDAEAMENAAKALSQFDIQADVFVMSAHRTPDAVKDLATNAVRRGYSCIIAGAGMSAHLAGVIASHTTLPVIGVPMKTSLSGGLDSLLSIVQMPRGVPVATVAVGGSGAYNAGVLAAQIIGAGDARMRSRVAAFKRKQVRDVAARAQEYLSSRSND